MGIALNEPASVDPEVWRIVDGQLYLFYGREEVELWDKVALGTKIKADENWARLNEQ